MSTPRYFLVYPPRAQVERVLEGCRRAVGCGMWKSMRIFASDKTACLVLSDGGLEQVKNPHVTEWRDTFAELRESELKSRLSSHRFYTDTPP